MGHWTGKWLSLHALDAPYTRHVNLDGHIAASSVVPMVSWMEVWMIRLAEVGSSGRQILAGACASPAIGTKAPA
jgi:hypothetical protein